MNRGKIFLKNWGLETVFLFLETIVTTVGEILQFLFISQDGPYYGFGFAYMRYQYNYFMYGLGLVFFLLVGYFLSKWFEKFFLKLDRPKLIGKILLWLNGLMWLIIMACINVFIYFLAEGFNSSVEPEVLLYITLIGWPIIFEIRGAALLVKAGRQKLNLQN